MAMHFQCPRCGRSFYSSSNSICYNCGAEAKNPLLDIIRWTAVVFVGGALLWYFVLVPAFNLIALAFSIIPMAYGIAAAYLVAAVTPERMPPMVTGAFPVLGFILACFALRTLIFFRRRGRTALIFLVSYLSFALSVGLLLSYTNLQPFGFDANSAGAGVPGLVEGRLWVFEYLTFGKLPHLLSAYQSYAEFIAGFDVDLLAVSLVVYWFVLPMDVTLLIVAWATHVNRKEMTAGQPAPADVTDVVDKQT